MCLILNDTKGEFAVQKSMQLSVFLVKRVNSNATLVFFFVLQNVQIHVVTHIQFVALHFNYHFHDHDNATVISLNSLDQLGITLDAPDTCDLLCHCSQYFCTGCRFIFFQNLSTY